MPSLQGIFYQNQFWDAKSLLIKFIRRAKKELIVIDAYPGVATLDMLAKRGRGVKIELVTHSNGELAESDFEAFGKYCGSSAPGDQAFEDAATGLGRFIAEHGMTLVFGGSNIGTMKTLADAALSAGGKVVGVFTANLPMSLAHHGLTEQCARNSEPTTLKSASTARTCRHI